MSSRPHHTSTQLFAKKKTRFDDSPFLKTVTTAVQYGCTTYVTSMSMKRGRRLTAAMVLSMLNWSAAGEDDRRLPADVVARRQCFQTGLRKSLACPYLYNALRNRVGPACVHQHLLCTKQTVETRRIYERCLHGLLRMALYMCVSGKPNFFLLFSALFL